MYKVVFCIDTSVYIASEGGREGRRQGKDRGKA